VVDPGVRGRGIGSKLLEASQQFAMGKILNLQDRCVIILDCVREMGNERYYAGRKFKTVKEETMPRGYLDE
jgi:hypothetical protein